MKEIIKSYFQEEVSKLKTPPIPKFNKKRTINPWENLLLAALAVASLVIVYIPSNYSSEIRAVSLSKELKVALENDFTRVIQGVNFYVELKIV